MPRLPGPSALLMLAACTGSLHTPAPVVEPAEAVVPDAALQVAQVEPPAPPPPPVYPRESGRVSIVAAGDIIPHPSIKDVAARQNQLGPDGVSVNQEGWSALFKDVAAQLQAADLAFVNLETPVAPDNHKALASKIFNAPPALLDALVATGIDVISFANNHVYDQGRTGFVETLDRLDRQPLVYLGAGRTCAEASTAKVVEVNGLKLAFIGSTRLHNAHLNRGLDQPCSFVLDPKVTSAEAARAKAAGADAVILSVHWGVEYETAPRSWDRDLAHKILDGGVDAIIGHHPHVLQPVERYDTKDGRHTFVAYSLGNFVSGQGLHYQHGVHTLATGNTRDGALLRFSVVKTETQAGVFEVSLSELSVEPLWSETATLSCMREPGVRAYIRPVVDATAAESARAAAEVETDPVRRTGYNKCAAMYDSRRAHAAGVLGAQWVPASAPATLAGG